MNVEQSKEAPVKTRMGRCNTPFIIVVLILLGLGLTMMFSASYAVAISEGKVGYYYGLRQGIFAIVGLILMFVMSRVDYHIFQKRGLAFLLYAFAVMLLILVLFCGTDLDTGCQRWLNLGFTTFQPSELAKFAVVILFAYLIDLHINEMKKFMVGIVPFLVMLCIIGILLMGEPHLSCTILIFVIGMSQIFVGGVRWWHMLILIILAAVAVVVFVYYKTTVSGYSYIQSRLVNWLDPFGSDDVDATWQIRQSLIAIGSGGLFGLGIGESRQKYQYLPESENDFVFSIVCEELGLVGAVTIILLFGLLLLLGMHIASHAKDPFGKLITIGFIVQIGLQAFINIAVVSGAVPNTGISLPFFSYGGTALVMQLVEMGIVLNISRPRIPLKKTRSQRREQPQDPLPEPPYVMGKAS